MQETGAVLDFIFSSCGIARYGICAFDACLPLLACRAQERLPQPANSVIVCLFPYPACEYPQRNVARYAVPADYHTVAGGRLADACERLAQRYTGEAFAWFVDNSPIREVAAAQMAGLGVCGENGLLQCAEYGSDFFIGTIVTGLLLPYARPTTGGCIRCGRCTAVCPTGALRAGEAFDRERCRSHITQKKGVLTPWEEQQIREGGLVWGCDLCTDVCPANRAARRRAVPPFGGQEDPLITPEALDRLLKEKSYGYRGKKLLRRNLELLNPPSVQEKD